jgi:hypothetical protein
MFCITVSKEKLPQLDAEGAQVRINGRAVILKKVGDTLQWDDGKESRTIMLDEEYTDAEGKEGIHFTCV